MIREFTFTDVLYLIAAMRWTLALTAIAFIGGGIVGLAIALLRVSPLAPLRWIGTIYVLAVQGTPLLAWLFVFFFGLSIVGVEVSPGSPRRRPTRSTPAHSWARSGAAACRRSPRPNGRPAPRSACR